MAGLEGISPGAMDKLKRMGSATASAVPNSPLPSSNNLIPTPKLASPVGHLEENDPVDNAFYSGAVFPKQVTLGGGQQITIPGLASNPDLDARKQYAKNQQQQRLAQRNRTLGVTPSTLEGIKRLVQ